MRNLLLDRGLRPRLEALHKILSWHLPDLSGQFQFEQRRKDFRRRQVFFQSLHDFIDVRGLIGA
jgi:hypothetical protein